MEFLWLLQFCNLFLAYNLIIFGRFRSLLLDSKTPSSLGSSKSRANFAAFFRKLIYMFTRWTLMIFTTTGSKKLISSSSSYCLKVRLVNASIRTFFFLLLHKNLPIVFSICLHEIASSSQLWRHSLILFTLVFC